MRVGFSTKRFDSGSTIHHAQANLRRRVATKKCRLLGGSEDHEIPEVAMTHRKGEVEGQTDLSRLLSGSLLGIALVGFTGVTYG
jgi:hypothetical protein